MTREDARAEINSRLTTELPKAGKQANGYDTYICPICRNGSGKNGTGIATKDGIHYKCFKCGESGDFLHMLKKKHNTESETVIFNLYGLKIDDSGTPSRPSATATVNQPSNKRQKEPPTDFTQFFLQARNNLKTAAEGIAYLQKRGISLETAERLAFGYVAEWKHPKRPYDQPDKRIIIPTSRHSYLARATEKGEKDKLKVGSVEPFNVNALYGDTPVYVTEAEIDAASIIEAGQNACALGAASMVRKFVEVCKLSPPSVPLILSLDNDEAGRKAQAELKAELEKLSISVYEVNTAGKYKDPNEHLTADRAAFTALVNSDPAENARREAEREKIKYLETSAAYHINAFIGEIAAFANTQTVSTGFKKLDDALDGGLYEGLYVIGAVSSLGKTSFMLQAADQMAMQGYDVLMFSLEMSRFELMAKSISRLTFENCGGDTQNAKTTRGILAGARHRYYSEKERELMNKSIISYGDYSGHIYIHEGIGTIGAEQVRQEVQKHISFTGNIPVVIIDYLQILAPFDMRATDKQNTDKSVLELKRLSRDKKIPVIAISSFNRDNYTAPVNLASFKESGAIEYSSDVLLGMQLAGMDELSQSESKRADTIRIIEEKKKEDPRKAQLKILKNRNGKIGVSLYYDYYPMFNCFKETTNAADNTAIRWR